MLRNKLEVYRMNLLADFGVLTGAITPIDDEFLNRLKDTYVTGIPVYFYIKYLRPLRGLGKCYDRSLYLFFALKEATLVRANVRPLELLHGKDGAGHGWIEMDGYVYDPTTLCRYTKDIYYKINKPKDITYTTAEDYCSNKENKDFYDSVTSTTLEDLKPYGKHRFDLSCIIPLVQSINEIEGNEEFAKEFDEYLESIEYDYEEIMHEMDEKLKEMVKKRVNN